MRILKGIPQDVAFFHRYAGIIPTLHRSGYLAQVVSFATEIGIIYSLIFTNLTDFIPSQYAHAAALVGAFLGAGVIEVGLRKFLPYGTRAILYKRFQGLDLVMTAFIIAGAVLLLATSGLLSFQGSKDLVKAVAPEPEQTTTATADSLANTARLEASTIYRADSSAIASLWNGKITAQATRQEGYLQREKRTGRSYATRRQRIAETIAQLESQKAEALAEAWEAHAARLNGISTAQDSTRQDVALFNAGKEEEAAAQVARYGGGLAYFTLACLVLLVVSVVLNEVYLKGAKIEEKAQPGQYAFAPGLWEEAAAALVERLQYSARRKITAFASATPPPPLPDKVKPLFDMTGVAIASAKVESEADEGQVIRLPVHQLTEGKSQLPPATALEYLKAAKELEAIAPQAAEALTLKANEVLRMYLGPEGTPEAVASLREQCEAHLAGNAPSPFAHHHRRPIGYQKPTIGTGAGQDALTHCVKDASPGTEEQPTASSKRGNCLHCKNDYTKRTTWQKYCSEGCRKEAHAVKHGGKAFDPNYKPWT